MAIQKQVHRIVVTYIIHVISYHDGIYDLKKFVSLNIEIRTFQKKMKSSFRIQSA